MSNVYFKIILWLFLVLTNLIVQVFYFYNDKNRKLFHLKKITTPLLLFSALIIVIIQSKSFPLIPCAIFIAMGLGEIGIEGSSVVESHNKDNSAASSLVELLAGILFLLVNIFIGVYLLWHHADILYALFAAGVAIIVILSMNFLTFKIFKPQKIIQTQMLLYSIGLIILCTGTLVDIMSGISSLGQAAAILTVSDSLVLFRMGAGFDKKTSGGFKWLLFLLIVILLLYYTYMAVLIKIGINSAML